MFSKKAMTGPTEEAFAIPEGAYHFRAYVAKQSDKYLISIFGRNPIGAIEWVHGLSMEDRKVVEMFVAGTTTTPDGSIKSGMSIGLLGEELTFPYQYITLYIEEKATAYKMAYDNNDDGGPAYAVYINPFTDDDVGKKFNFYFTLGPDLEPTA